MAAHPRRSSTGGRPPRRQSPRDGRRRSLGQNLLVDDGVVERLLARLDLRRDELVIDIGAGRGALTIPIASVGARVVAIERDRRMVADLQQRLEAAGVANRVRIRRADLREVPWPGEPFRVVANPPYGLTTTLLSRLLDDPRTGLLRVDLLVQVEVARKRSSEPPTTLRSAAWAPWWRFDLGERVPRQAFRPVPSVDAAWLTITRRDPPVLPAELAPRFREVLEPHWSHIH